MLVYFESDMSAAADPHASLLTRASAGIRLGGR
jgi:hypothetical protein